MRIIAVARPLIAWAALWAGATVLAAEPQPAAPPAAPAEDAAKKAETPKPDATKPDAAKPDSAKPAAASKSEATAAKPAAPTEAEADQALAVGTGQTDEEKLPPPPTGADKKGSPQRFTPSEQVRADFDVSFPIDI